MTRFSNADSVSWESRSRGYSANSPDTPANAPCRYPPPPIPTDAAVPRATAPPTADRGTEHDACHTPNRCLERCWQPGVTPNQRCLVACWQTEID